MEQTVKARKKRAHRQTFFSAAERRSVAENKEQRSDKNRCKNSTSVSCNIFKIPKIRLSRNWREGREETKEERRAEPAYRTDGAVQY